MKPFTVSYCDVMPEVKPKQKVITRAEMSSASLEAIGQAIDNGDIDHVVIVGQGNAIGWRVLVDREFRFIDTADASERLALIEAQASVRFQTKIG